MLKAVVFDDEYIVLQGLRAMIDWPKFGIELAGTAENGIAALELFRSVQPDIILTDIRMPGLDGLQLIEQVMKEAPQTYCIVFSGFNEFEYVKRAIELGVADYLEKPITIGSIEKSIRKMTERLQKQQEVQAMRQQLEGNRQELMEKALLDLLVLGAEAETKFRLTFGREADTITAITVFVAASDGFSLPKDPEGYELVRVRNGQEWITVALHLQQPGTEFWSLVLSESDHEQLSVGAGLSHAQLTDAQTGYREAQRALKVAQYLGQKGVIRYEDLGELTSSAGEVSEHEEAILLSFRSGNKASLLAQVDRFLHWLQTEKLDPEVAERELLHLIYRVMDVSKEVGGDKLRQAMENERFLPHVEIRQSAEQGRMLEWFRSKAAQIAGWTMETQENAKHAAVEQARVFMELNCARDLSLQEVADHVGMNATYLSVLFKEAMGQSYIKYLTSYRIELAKSLLAKGMKVNEVSEKVGYHTYRHFSEVFKKYTGVTPGQYKEQP